MINNAERRNTNGQVLARQSQSGKQFVRKTKALAENAGAFFAAKRVDLRALGGYNESSEIYRKQVTLCVVQKVLLHARFEDTAWRDSP